MFRKKKPESHYEMSLLALVKTLIISKLPRPKEKVADNPVAPANPTPEGDINYIAIVLDNVVEDVMRTQNRLAALLLSNPEFIEFDPKEDRPQIGTTQYIDGKFKYPSEDLMTDDEIEETLNKMGVEKNNED